VNEVAAFQILQEVVVVEQVEIGLLCPSIPLKKAPAQ
jgi:hypothetical protein